MPVPAVHRADRDVLELGDVLEFQAVLDFQNDYLALLIRQFGQGPAEPRAPLTVDEGPIHLIYLQGRCRVSIREALPGPLTAHPVPDPVAYYDSATYS